MIQIYSLMSPNGSPTFAWLCPDHVKAREAADWKDIKATGVKLDPDGRCDDCIHDKRAA